MSKENKGGRPPNVYGVPFTKFNQWFQLASRKSPNRVLASDASSVAYVAKTLDENSGVFEHLFRVTLTPQVRGSAFHWVHLETPDGAVDFTIPAPMHIKDIDELILPRWDVDNAWWVLSSDLPSISMPGRMPKALIKSSRAYYVLARDHAHSPLVKLKLLRGAHTISRGLFCGVVTSPEEMKFISAYFEPRPGNPEQPPAPFPNIDAEVTPQQLTRLRMVGAAWARHHFYEHRKLDESGEPSVWPFVPHADLLEVPFIARTELSL